MTIPLKDLLTILNNPEVIPHMKVMREEMLNPTQHREAISYNSKFGLRHVTKVKR